MIISQRKRVAFFNRLMQKMRRAVGFLLREGLRKEVRRNTWVFAHAKNLPTTPSGEEQRAPFESQEYQMYNVLRNEDQTETPLRIILTTYVEELGNWGDVVETDRELGRSLILRRDAQYASPFNLQEFEERKKQLGDNVPPRISLHALKTAREVSASVLEVPLSLQQEWIMEPWHIRVALRKLGHFVDESGIVMPKEAIVGPNLALESKLFRFYLLINKQVVVPMLGRLHHVGDDTQEVLKLGVEHGVATKQELNSANIKEQYICILDEPLIRNSDVWSNTIQEKLSTSKNT